MAARNSCIIRINTPSHTPLLKMLLSLTTNLCTTHPVTHKQLRELSIPTALTHARNPVNLIGHIHRLQKPNQCIMSTYSATTRETYTSRSTLLLLQAQHMARCTAPSTLDKDAHNQAQQQSHCASRCTVHCMSTSSSCYKHNNAHAYIHRYKFNIRRSCLDSLLKQIVHLHC